MIEGGKVVRLVDPVEDQPVNKASSRPFGVDRDGPDNMVLPQLERFGEHPPGQTLGIDDPGIFPRGAVDGDKTIAAIIVGTPGISPTIGARVIRPAATSMGAKDAWPNDSMIIPREICSFSCAARSIFRTNVSIVEDWQVALLQSWDIIRLEWKEYQTKKHDFRA